jgi:hypothetical protein
VGQGQCKTILLTATLLFFQHPPRDLALELPGLLGKPEEQVSSSGGTHFQHQLSKTALYLEETLKEDAQRVRGPAARSQRTRHKSSVRIRLQEWPLSSKRASDIGIDELAVMSVAGSEKIDTARRWTYRLETEQSTSICPSNTRDPVAGNTVAASQWWWSGVFSSSPPRPPGLLRVEYSTPGSKKCWNRIRSPCSLRTR